MQDASLLQAALYARKMKSERARRGGGLGVGAGGCTSGSRGDVADVTMTTWATGFAYTTYCALKEG